MNFSYETSFGIPKAQPEYLRAADYMILYNEALRNDGGNPMYSYQDIENARAGVDPVKYPDQDYYSSEFLRGFKPQNRVSAEFIGGSRVAQYYLNAGFYNTKSIVSMGESDKQRTNRFNVRGNVDVNINKYIKVSLDAAAIFNSYHGPNWKNGNFWRLSTENPVNSYPFLIPVDRLDMEDEYTKTALEDAELANIWWAVTTTIIPTTCAIPTATSIWAVTPTRWTAWHISTWASTSISRG